MPEIVVLVDSGGIDRRGSFKIKTTIATLKEEVDEAIKALMSNAMNHDERLIGLDMIPIRGSGETTSSILQLCDSSQCLLVRLHSFNDVPDSLYNFLILPSFIFAGFGIKDTIASLKKDYGLVCKNTLEVAPSMWKRSKCFRFPSRVFTAMYVPPTSRISHAWGRNGELDEDEITLAVSNAFAAYRLGSKMLGSYY